MKKFIRKLGLLAAYCVLVLSGAVAPCGSVVAQDVIGVLPEVLRPEIAEKLKLADDQRAKLSELINRRRGEAIGLSQQLRSVPPDQKESLRTGFRIESERMGYELLNADQRAILEKIRIERMGLLGLAEPGLAKQLNLADWQIAKAAELAAKVSAASRAPNADAIRADAERNMRGEISDTQWNAWQILAGRFSGELGNPQPPERKLAVAAPATPRIASTAPMAKSGDIIPVDDVELQMNFQSMPWPDVLNWLREQADLSLQVDAMPPGSFTYRDNSRKYSIGEAMDIMSASLLNKGFSLLRRDRLLMVIDLESPQVKNMIDELSEYISLEELDLRGDFELVKVLFPLSRMNPDDAKKEVEQLLSLQGKVVSLPSAGQIVVTDTAGVVRAIRAVIERVEDPEKSRNSSIIALPLTHISANELLDVARPLLNIPEGQNSNADISLSMDTFGNTLLLNAKKPEDVQKLRDLVQYLDVAPSGVNADGVARETPVVQIHVIKGSDPDLSFRVLSQRLASETDVRMEMDKETNKLVVEARPSTHKEIDEVLAMLSGEGTQFEVVDLKNLDTQVALATIKKFFNIADSGKADPTAPIVDGDLIMRRLYVKASKQQMEQIKLLIEKLQGSSSTSDLGDNIRIIPLPPRKLDRTMEQLQQLWSAKRMVNRLRMVVPGESNTESALPQKAIVPEPATPAAASDATEPAKAVPAGASKQGKANKKQSAELLNRKTRFVKTQTEKTQSEKTQSDGEPEAEIGDDIVIMPGPGGLIVTSNDKQALAEFDKLLRMVAETGMNAIEPTFYWLKFIKAADAKVLLESILSGTTTSSSSGGGGLLGNVMSEVGGGLLGGLLGSGGSSVTAGATSLTSGDVIINADPRLNCLIIRANAQDMELCEQLMKVIDQPDSPISVQTRGMIEIIPVASQDAEAVATTIKTLLGDRVEGGGGGGGGGGGQRAPDPQAFIQALTGAGGGRGGGRGNSQLAEPKIAIGVDKNINSLVVMGQPQDIALIRSYVEKIDVAGEDSEENVVVVSLEGTSLNSKMISAAVKGVLGPKARTNTTTQQSTASTTQPSSGGPGGSGGGPNPDFIQQLRDRFQQGGSGTSTFRGGFPGGGFPGGGTQGGGGFPGFGGFRGFPGGGGGGGTAPQGGSGRGGR